MRFFRILKQDRGTGQINYTVQLYTTPLKQEDIPLYTGTVGSFNLPGSDSLELNYYCYEDTPAKISYNGDCKINANDPSQVLKSVEILSTLPNLDISTILVMLTHKGWRQIFYDQRCWNYFFENTMPSAEMMYYGYHIKSISDSGEKHNEYIHVFAKDDADAVGKAIDLFRTRITTLRTDLWYSKFYASLCGSFGEWIAQGMPHFERVSVDPDIFARTYTEVKAKFLLNLVIPPVQPQLAAASREEESHV